MQERRTELMPGALRKDKRQSERIHHEVLAYIPEKEHYYVTRNISENGCQILMDDPIEE